MEHRRCAAGQDERGRVEELHPLVYLLEVKKLIERFIEELAESEKMDKAELEELVQDYFYTGRMPHGDRIVKTLVEKPKLLERKHIIQRVKEKLQQFIEVFEEW